VAVLRQRGDACGELLQKDDAGAMYRTRAAEASIERSTATVPVRRAT